LQHTNYMKTMRISRSWASAWSGVVGVVLTGAVLLSGCASSGPAGSAAGPVTEQGAQRSKADQLLLIASVELKRHMYQAAQAELDRCAKLDGSLTSSQKKRLAKYREEAEAGIGAQRTAQEAITQGDGHLQAGELGAAAKQFDNAYALRDHLPKTTVARIRDKQQAVKTRKSAGKKRIVQLFRQSREQYRQGSLDDAEAGFKQVDASGIKLSLADRRGDLTTPTGYLKKIGAAKAKQQAQEAASAREAAVAAASEAPKKKAEPAPAVAEPAAEADVASAAAPAEKPEPVATVAAEPSKPAESAPAKKQEKVSKDDLASAAAPSAAACWPARVVTTGIR